MPAQTTVEPLIPSRDARGFVVEPLSLAQLTLQKNVHGVWTAPGAVRGNHHHVRGTENALVLGPAMVRYGDANGMQDIHIESGALYRFTFPPKCRMLTVRKARSRCCWWCSTQKFTTPGTQMRPRISFSVRKILRTTHEGHRLIRS